MLITESLHLLLTTPEGTPQTWASRSLGANAALVTDLVVAERVVLSDEKRPRVSVVSTAPTGHPVLDPGLALLATRDGKRLDSLVSWARLDPKEAVVESLVAQGVLTLGQRTMLGLGAPRTPERNPEPEQMLRARLAAVLAGQAEADVTETTLLGILQGLGVARTILRAESGELRGGSLKKRIQQVVESSPTGTAVERAVDAVIAATTAAVTVAVTAGS